MLQPEIFGHDDHLPKPPCYCNGKWSTLRRGVEATNHTTEPNDAQKAKRKINFPFFVRSSHSRFPLIICRIRRLPELFETHLHLRLVNQTGIDPQHSKNKISKDHRMFNRLKREHLWVVRRRYNRKWRCLSVVHCAGTAFCYQKWRQIDSQKAVKSRRKSTFSVKGLNVENSLFVAL